ncbi:MAG: hypothetical protein ACYDDA_03705 [Acidiferrobacteraceae bacterium]
MTVDEIEWRRRSMMAELKEFVTVHTREGNYGLARRFLRALIELQNAAFFSAEDPPEENAKSSI